MLEHLRLETIFKNKYFYINKLALEVLFEGFLYAKNRQRAYKLQFIGNNFVMKTKIIGKYGANSDERESRVPKTFDPENARIENSVKR